MTHPETLCETIVEAITEDSFTFSYGKRPDQNFDADELEFPHVFLDKPIKSKDKTFQSKYREAEIAIVLFFAYKQELDATEPDKFANIKQKAWNAAREFVLRLQANEEVREIVSETRTDVDNVFDINLCGCLLEVTYIIRDASSTCLV